MAANHSSIRIKLSDKMLLRQNYRTIIFKIFVLLITVIFLVLVGTQLEFFSLWKIQEGEVVKTLKIARMPEKNTQSVGETESHFPAVKELKLCKGMKKFDNEGSRVPGLALHKIGNISNFTTTKIIYLATRYFGKLSREHYYAPNLGSETFTRYPCPESRCEFTNDIKFIPTADAMLFHVRDFQIENMPNYRHHKQIYIIYSMEPPWLELFDFRRFEGFFNWTMSYREGSDVLVKYGFIGRRPVAKKYTSISSDVFRKKENRAVWLVSDCCTDSNRELFVSMLRIIYPVEVIGGCGAESCQPAETEKCYNSIAKRFKFYLAFENAHCRRYVTEKLFNVLEFDIIPVVFGGADYSNIVPENSVINANNFHSPEDLGWFLWTVSHNMSLYNSFFTWKKTWRSYLQPWMCDLCQKLHSADIQPTVKTELQSWWTENESCKRWTENGYRKTNPVSLPCYRKKLSLFQ